MYVYVSDQRRTQGSLGGYWTPEINLESVRSIKVLITIYIWINDFILSTLGAVTPKVDKIKSFFNKHRCQLFIDRLFLPLPLHNLGYATDSDKYYNYAI